MDEIETIIKMLPEAEQKVIWDRLSEYQDTVIREQGQVDFMKFVETMWPGFIHGRHHALMAKKFEDIANGKIRRLIINMPPRHKIGRAHV